MKKSFLALAVAALAASSIVSTASAATVYDKDGTSLAVYGRVQSVLYSDKASGVKFDNNGVGKADEEASIKTSGRLGVDMRTQIFGDVAAFGKMEWDVANGDVEPGKDDSFGARYLWVGLDFAQAGQVKFGRFEPAMKYAISQTDIFDDWGCTGIAGNDDKRKAVVQYQWSGMGFDFIGSYVFANNGEHVDGAFFTGANETVDMDYTVSFAAGYTSPDVLFGPIAVRLGYEKGEFADSSANTNVAIGEWKPGSGTNAPTLHNGVMAGAYMYDSYDQFAIGLSWGSLDMGPYVGALYQKRTFDVNVLNAKGYMSNGTQGTTDKLTNGETEVEGYEFVVGYSFPNGITLRTGYLVQEYTLDTESVEAKTVPVYANWQLNPQFNVWAEARFDAGTDDSEDGKNFADVVPNTNYQENVFSAGVRYQF